MEEQETKGVPKGWIIAFSTLLSIGVILDITQVTVEPWVISEDPTYGFEGTFARLAKAHGDFFKDVEGEPFWFLREQYCEYHSASWSLCRIFSGLESSFIGGLIGICLGILWTGGCITILVTRRKPRTRAYVIIFSVLSIFTHVGTAVGCIVSNSIVFFDNCEDLIDEELLCAGVGSHLLLYGMIYHVSLMVAILIVMRILKHRQNTPQIPQAPMPQPDTSAIISGVTPVVRELRGHQEATEFTQHLDSALNCYPPLPQYSEVQKNTVYPPLADRPMQADQEIEQPLSELGVSSRPLNIPEALVPEQSLEEILRSESSDEDH